MGLSEIFAMLASFEYAYFAAPRSAQTLFMSLRFCSLGVSSYLANGYFAIFKNTRSGLDFSVSMRIMDSPSIILSIYCSVNREIHHGLFTLISLFLPGFSLYLSSYLLYARKNLKSSN